jgi:hypothetical protein
MLKTGHGVNRKSVIARLDVLSGDIPGDPVTTEAAFETPFQGQWLLDAPLEAGHDTHSIQLFSAVS